MSLPTWSTINLVIAFVVSIVYIKQAEHCDALAFKFDIELRYGFTKKNHPKDYHTNYPEWKTIWKLLEIIGARSRYK